MAGDEEVVRFFDCDSLTCLSEFKAHENRYFFSLFPVGSRLKVGLRLRGQAGLEVSIWPDPTAP